MHSTPPRTRLVTLALGATFRPLWRLDRGTIRRNRDEIARSAVSTPGAPAYSKLIEPTFPMTNEECAVPDTYPQ